MFFGKNRYAFKKRVDFGCRVDGNIRINKIIPLRQGFVGQEKKENKRWHV